MKYVIGEGKQQDTAWLINSDTLNSLPFPTSAAILVSPINEEPTKFWGRNDTVNNALPFPIDITLITSKTKEEPTKFWGRNDTVNNEFPFPLDITLITSKTKERATRFWGLHSDLLEGLPVPKGVYIPTGEKEEGTGEILYDLKMNGKTYSIVMPNKKEYELSFGEGKPKTKKLIATKLEPYRYFDE